MFLTMQTQLEISEGKTNVRQTDNKINKILVIPAFIDVQLRNTTCITQEQNVSGLPRRQIPVYLSRYTRHTKLIFAEKLLPLTARLFLFLSYHVPKKKKKSARAIRIELLNKVSVNFGSMCH